jgi:tRNA U34 5-methylaminomethyl-2-thiouridine-forming methyltransferase MnmC
MSAFAPSSVIGNTGERIFGQVVRITRSITSDIIFQTTTKGLKFMCRERKTEWAFMKQLEPTKSPEQQLGWKVWLALFMKRHHKMSLRQPEITSLARVSVFNKIVVHMIFDLSENICDEKKLQDFLYGQILAHSPAAS